MGIIYSCRFSDVGRRVSAASFWLFIVDFHNFNVPGFFPLAVVMLSLYALLFSVCGPRARLCARFPPSLNLVHLLKDGELVNGSRVILAHGFSMLTP